MLQPIQLQTLRVVLTTGSFASAAEALSYTPSAVSQQMAALERASGLNLFERSAHSVRATPYAQLLADRAGDLLAVLDELNQDVAAMARGESGRLRVGSFPTASARLLPAALARLTGERPGIDIEVDEGELDSLLPRLISGELDLALAYRYDAVPSSWPSPLVEMPLLDERLALLLPASHPRCSTDSVRLSSLRAERWVAPLADSPGAVNLDRVAARAGFSPRVSFRSNDYSVVRGLVAAGLGVALVPSLALEPTEGAVVKPLAGPAVRRRVLALHRPASHNALISAALSAIAAIADALLL
jgi:DNA-binding transcriptional LysR family regulator